MAQSLYDERVLALYFLLCFLVLEYFAAVGAFPVSLASRSSAARVDGLDFFKSVDVGFGGSNDVAADFADLGLRLGRFRPGGVGDYLVVGAAQRFGAQMSVSGRVLEQIVT